MIVEVLLRRSKLAQISQFELRTRFPNGGIRSGRASREIGG